MIKFAHEAPRRLRTALLGTSGHAYRNFLPSLPYAPVELVGIWDPDKSQAEKIARQFGAPEWFNSVDKLLAETKPEAVIIATEGMEQDEPAGTRLMIQALEAGCHAWTDKPVAGSVNTVSKLIQIRNKVEKVAAVGIKTMYYPTHQRVREIVRNSSFGRPASISIRYPLSIPQQADLPMTDRSVISCLGHLWHPFGAALLIVGTMKELHLETGSTGKGGVAVAKFAEGTVGTFHFSSGRSQTSPLEFLEVIGEGENVTVENAVQLTHYRKGSPGTYGRSASFLTNSQNGPLRWEPEFSLGQLYNTNNFIQGYAPSLIAFAEAALGNSALQYGTLEDAREVLKIFEALRKGPGKVVTV